MIKILFVCHGNICRSTMAQYVMQDLVDRAALADAFGIDSAATSYDEIGSPIDRRTRKVLQRHHIWCGDHRARHLIAADYANFDYLVGMDSYNMRNMRSMVGGDSEHKLSLLLDWAGKQRDIADPWYTGNFDATFDDVLAGCTGLFDHVTREL
ncbi:low molecular weight protein-tyrosine-phosphatase [Atopobium deltae]|nr:low molecular weight protein-tyrosine-phosphatase [Atopobium deltae]